MDPDGNDDSREEPLLPQNEEEPLLPQNEEEPSPPRNDQVEEDGVVPPQSAAGNVFQEWASFIGAVFNFSTTIIGAGIMALPAAMKELGLVLGIVSIVFVAFLTELSLDLLIRFSREGNDQSYAAVMHSAYGKCGKILLNIFVIVNNVGVLVVYMIIIGDVLSGTSSSTAKHPGVLEEWFHHAPWNGRFCVLLIITILILAPLACFRHIDHLKYSSGVAMLLAVVFVVVTAGIAIAKLVNQSIAKTRWYPDVAKNKSNWNLVAVVPVIVTAFVCHYNVHSIDQELGNPSLIKGVRRTSLVLCTIVYLLTSISCYLIFGDGILDDVLSNFDTGLGIPNSDWLSVFVRLSYAVHLMLVFPVMFFSLRLSVDGLLFPSAGPLVSNNIRFNSISAVLIILIFVTANYVPSIWSVFQFTGSTATVCLGFIFPAGIALRNPHGTSTWKEKTLSIFMLALAAFSSIVALCFNMGIISSRHKNT